MPSSVLEGIYDIEENISDAVAKRLRCTRKSIEVFGMVRDGACHFVHCFPFSTAELKFFLTLMNKLSSKK